LDNLTHSLTGWALGQAGLKTKSRKGLAALILGANAPDIDVFFQWVSYEPLATHRGITHSLIGGGIVLPLILWGLLLGLDRWQVKRGVEFKSGLPMKPGWLLALCYIGAITHPLLDLQTTYSVQLLSPLSGRWFHSDSLFIIDAWIWLLLVFAIAISQAMEGEGDRHWGRPVQAALAVAFAYICFNIGLSETAVAEVRHRTPNATAIFASPPPIAFWRRDMVWREGRNIDTATYRPFAGGLGPTRDLGNDGMADPTVRSAIQRSKGLRKFLHSSILSVATVSRSGCRATVNIGDARYLEPGTRSSRLAREDVVSLC